MRYPDIFRYAKFNRFHKDTSPTKSSRAQQTFLVLSVPVFRRDTGPRFPPQQKSSPRATRKKIIAYKRPNGWRAHPISLTMTSSFSWRGVSADSDTRFALILPHWELSPTACTIILQSALWLTSVKVQLYDEKASSQEENCRKPRDGGQRENFRQKAEYFRRRVASICMFVQWFRYMRVGRHTFRSSYVPYETKDACRRREPGKGSTAVSLIEGESGDKPGQHW